MDFATLFGIGASFLLIISAIFIGGSVGFFFDLASFLIVFGGATGSLLINFPMKEVMAVMNVARKVFLYSAKPVGDTIEVLVRIAEKARREGILAIEREIEDIDDPFIKMGVQYAVDGTEPETIRAILESELQGMLDRHALGKKIFDQMGIYFPAYGMIGTLIGLIQMLANLSDPKAIGPGMAVAIVTTFYGAVVANVICVPMAGKLEQRSKEESKRKQLVIEGILSIQSGDNPRIVREKLLTYLPPKARDSEGGGGMGERE